MQKILIIRFSSIGDIVLTTPIVRCIKQQLNAEVHYITKKQFAPILESNPYIDKIYTIEKNVSEIKTELKKENYGFAVDLHNNLRSAQVKSILGKKSKSFYKLNMEKWLMVHLRINTLPDIHIVDRYFETVKPLGVKNDGKGLDYFIPEKDKVDINILPQEFHKGYVGFVIGAKHYTKQLPKEKIVSIIQKLNHPVVLFGGKEDAEKGNWIVQELRTRYPAAKIYNACGKYDLNQSASLVKQAGKIITHDTGLMHIAAAFKKEIVSVWGNTIPEFGMYPYYGNVQLSSRKLSGLRSQVLDLPCRPCSKIGFSKCPKKHFKCMNDINEEEIVSFASS